MNKQMQKNRSRIMKEVFDSMENKEELLKVLDRIIDEVKFKNPSVMFSRDAAFELLWEMECFTLCSREKKLKLYA